MKKPTPKTKSKPAKQAVLPTRVVFLLDRSGSMSTVKHETISGFNSYLDSLKDQAKTTVTAVQFDSQGIDTICSGESPKSATRLSDNSYEPRAWTPLYDAIGRTIRDTQSAVKGQKVLFVILTDGQENASTEFTLDSVKSLMKDRENQDHWTFAFIGMGPEGWAAQQSLAAGTQSFRNVVKFNQTGADTKRAYGKLSRATACYASSAGGQSVCSNFWSGEKDES